MKTLNVFPPNYRRINAAFGVRGKPVIFCYGDTIFNPSRVKIPPELIAHEAVHSRQQGNDPAGWWRRYIADPAFRLDQEIAAHIAEARDLDRRGLSFASVAARLASAVYGNLIDLTLAQRIIDDALTVRYPPTAIASCR